ncbi:MAG: hypothetical protein KatS3mg057_2240 [Herpetosiphonaceae bacterium]|nr:MAG: hypothetical protein KatS3mg057_2240 [Herpetosiphonaceae bacterium]
MEILALVARLTNRTARGDAARLLARHLGSHDLLIFIKDLELDELVPAAGFPQALPDDHAWRMFLAETLRTGQHRDELPFPDRISRCPALGIAGDDSAVLVLLGGSPHPKAVAVIAALLPLLSAALRGERAELAVAEYAAVARRMGAKAHTLTKAPNVTRRELQPAPGEVQEEWQRAAFLAEVSRLLAGSLEYETTIAGLVPLIVPFLADYVLIDLVERDGRLRNVLAAPESAQPVQYALQLGGAPVIENQVLYDSSHVVRDNKPELFPSSADAQNAVLPSTQQQALFERLGVSSALCVPLRARGQLVGALTLLLTRSGRLYHARDLALAQDLAHYLAVAIENARLYHESQQAIAMRDQFLSMAAHELRTPLTTLLGYTQLLQRQVELGGQAGSRIARALAAIGQQTRRLHRMSLALLDLSDIQANRLVIERAIVDLNDIVLRLVEELRVVSSRHSFIISSTDQPLLALGDALRLEQALYNILSNAIKYSVRGGNIFIQLERREDHVFISISDQGIGIPSEALPFVFRRFYRASNARVEQIAGLGLGLYLAREIIILHGGNIEVESLKDRGSTFRVTLPLYHSRGASNG